MVAFLSGYPRKENKSEGFDVSGLPVPDSAPGLTEHICNDTCSPLILLYAKLGLHRYNLVQGKNLQLSSVKKYNKSMASVNSSYYITLVAIHPATQLLQTFQTRVNELRYGELVLECCTARPLGETHICGIKKISDHKPVEDLLHTFPEWPPKNPFKKSKRCYVLKKSELRENDDWIRLYLELAVAASNRDTLENHLVSNLKIVKVAAQGIQTQWPYLVSSCAQDEIHRVFLEPIHVQR
ncbi:BnaA09g28780D [Brassica napus]|uniref:BnaA09g28780D protein n=1 Tax=Brassica napus TaxID=3708 RepID=A0A078FT92_BRANA|nr:BnaA09g28780D [Brassica napus]